MNEIFWIKTAAAFPPVRLAIVLRPRGGDWLEDELSRIYAAGIRVIVSMLEGWEADSLGLAQERELASRIGMTHISYPIQDRSLPVDRAAFRSFVHNLANRPRDGESVGIHCRGSIGRATLAAATTLVHLGWSPAEALDTIESARGCPVPDTDEQRQWILAYEVGQ